MTSVQPTADELPGMASWNSLTEAERRYALRAAGWKSGGTVAPAVADAWAALQAASAHGSFYAKAAALPRGVW